MMSRILHFTAALFLAGTVALSAFENPLIWKPVFREKVDEPPGVYGLTGNPAAYRYEGDLSAFRLQGRFDDRDYRRTYDPVSMRNLNAGFLTVRNIDENAFFVAGIHYDDCRQRDLFASMEKDFYDDYFSMADSTTGDVSYYGPQLRILYNVKLFPQVYLGLEGNYGVERSLKDTFPETITIMRNSGYRAGLDYRANRFSLGVFGRYYDDQRSYEAVKKYTNVKTYTYFGYNVFYHENPASRSEKTRTRRGLEYGGHFGFGENRKLSGDLSLSGIRRASHAKITRSSHTHERGLWLRKGLHITGDLNYALEGPLALRLYAERLRFRDWAESLISSTLVIENEEHSDRYGALLIYKPSLAQEAYLGAESGTVSYDYAEYVFPFESVRSGREWKIYAGSGLYMSPKTRFCFDLSYSKEIPRFYWDTESFRNTDVRISLEQLFSFGYITFDIEYVNKNPENVDKSISKYALGLSYIRK